MLLKRRNGLDLAVLAAAVLVQWQLGRWASEVPSVARSATRTRLVRRATYCAMIMAGLAPLLHYRPIYRWFPIGLVTWTQGLIMLWSFCCLGFLLLAFFWRQVPEAQWRRRSFLRHVAIASFAAPVIATGYGVFIQREKYHVKEVQIALPHLPPDLDGLRLVQLTDIHLSSFISERDVARVVDMANEQRAHLALVTGDLITRSGDPLDVCLRYMARLRAEAGILGCLGNHEVYARCEDYTAVAGAKLGVNFLRRHNRVLRFGEAELNVVGVDYQEMKSPYLVGVEKLVQHRPQTLNLLLSHNPDVFPVAARQGFDLTIAGHTHGGQVTVELLDPYLNPARFYTPFVQGLYRRENAAAYVSPGIGTIGMPARIGTQPEVSVITLCAT